MNRRAGNGLRDKIETGGNRFGGRRFLSRRGGVFGSRGGGDPERKESEGRCGGWRFCHRGA